METSGSVLKCIILASILSINGNVIAALDTQTVVKDLDTPWELVWGPDGWIWMTERPGRVSRVNPATGEVRIVGQLSDVHETGESGLLGMALHPNFSAQPLVYMVYNYLQNGVIKERLVRFAYNGATLDNREIILDNVNGASIHDGSRLLFLADTTLLMTTGDGSISSSALDQNSLSGKVLRMTADGKIPGNNPFGNSLVWSIGHRNPQGLTRAPDGTIYSSEHGPNNDDEVNLLVPGRNFGWPTVQGFCDGPAEQTYCTANNVVEPLAAWTPTLAVAGLIYYDHPAIPEWRRSLIMATLKESDVRVLHLDATGKRIESQEVFFNNAWGRLRAVCAAPNGDIYIGVSNLDGRGTPRSGDDRIVRIRGQGVNSIEKGKMGRAGKKASGVSGGVVFYDLRGRKIGVLEKLTFSKLKTGPYIIVTKSPGGDALRVVRVMKMPK